MRSWSLSDPPSCCSLGISDFDDLLVAQVHGQAARSAISAVADTPDPRRWIGLVLVLIASFLTAFDFFVVNVALPAMRTDLGARPAQLEFVVAGYGLAFAVLLVTGGRLGDLYGRKRMFILGMGGFTAASALCGVAPTAGLLIAARVLQGMTAAMMNPQVLAIIRVTFPEGERARAIGYFGMTLGAASILAQLIGGVLVQVDLFGLSWRPVFLVNVPIGLVALPLALRVLRESRAAGGHQLDPGGILIGSAALLLLAVPLVEGREAGWPGWAYAAMALSMPAFAAFVAWEWHVQHRCRVPLVNLRLFRDRGFSLGLLMAVTFFGGLSAFFMTITLFLQQGFGLTPLATGLTFVAFGIGFVGGSRLSSTVAARLGPRVINLGTALMGAGLLAIILMAKAASGSAMDGRTLAAALLVYGVGQGLTLPSLVTLVVGSSRIPAADAGSASGVFAMVQQVALALGVAVVGGVFFGALDGNTTRLAYDGALAAALSCNLGLLAATFALALGLRRKPPHDGELVPRLLKRRKPCKPR